MIKKNDITRSKADDFLRNGERSSCSNRTVIYSQAEENGCVIGTLS